MAHYEDNGDVCIGESCEAICDCSKREDDDENSINDANNYLRLAMWHWMKFQQNLRKFYGTQTTSKGNTPGPEFLATWWL